MRVVALISGGKDSCYNMMQCVREGHEIVALANLQPRDVDEMDSYMYQTVGHHAIQHYAEAMDLPLYRRVIQGTSKRTGAEYVEDIEDEVEDLLELLTEVKTDHDIEGVSVGAILSNYQRVRVEHVCSRLGLTSLAYLWRRGQDELLDEMIRCDVEAIIIKVAAMGLTETDLGKTLREIQPKMRKLDKEFGLNVCGEGGEYETFTLDCPLFRKRLVLDEKQVVMHTDAPFAPVAYLNLTKLHLEEKVDVPTVERLLDLPMKNSRDSYSELDLDQPDCTAIPRDYEQCSRQLSSASTSENMRNGNLCIAGLTCLDSIPLQEATVNVMEQLGVRLRAHDMTFEDVCVVHLYVRNMDCFHQLNQVYRRYFSTNPPVRICVQADLYSNEPLLLDCYAMKANSDGVKTMHVQGLSHWAPANIGPYSQCMMIGNKVYVAGQIGMVPSTLNLIEGGIRAQSRLALRHVQRVLEAMTNAHSLLSMLCYVVDEDFITTAKDELTEVYPNCIGIYLVVPKLPKNALVEWEAIASNCEEVETTDSSHDLDNLTLRCQKSTDSDGFANYQVLVNATEKKDACANVTSIVQLIAPHLRSSTTGLLRTFYRQQDFDADQLSQQIAQALTAENLEIAVTAVPVVGFADRETVLSLAVT